MTIQSLRRTVIGFFAAGSLLVPTATADAQVSKKDQCNVACAVAAFLYVQATGVEAGAHFYAGCMAGCYTGEAE